MKNGVYGILKARFLVNEDANKNWRFILFIILLTIIMIWNTNRYEQKIFKITDLTNEVKELRSEFVDRRSELMELKLESTIENMETDLDLERFRLMESYRLKADYESIIKLRYPYN